LRNQRNTVLWHKITLNPLQCNGLRRFILWYTYGTGKEVGKIALERENEVESFLRRETEKRGGLCVKFLPDFARGFPDRVVMLPGGVLVWAETKKPVGGRVSQVQRYVHATLRRLGQRVEVVWSKDQAAVLLEELDKKKTPGE
jgi:hypothetical protein